MNLQTLQSLIASVPVDWFILACIAIFLTVDAMRSGFARGASLAISFPLALLFLGFIPHTLLLSSVVSDKSIPYAQAAVFLVLLVLTFILVYRMVSSYGAMPASLTSAFLIAVATTVVIVLVWVQVPALLSLWRFGALLQNIFGEAYRLFWLLGAYAILAFVRG